MKNPNTETTSAQYTTHPIPSRQNPQTISLRMVAGATLTFIILSLRKLCRTLIITIELLCSFNHSHPSPFFHCPPRVSESLLLFRESASSSQVSVRKSSWYTDDPEYSQRIYSPVHLQVAPEYRHQKSATSLVEAVSPGQDRGGWVGALQA